MIDQFQLRDGALYAENVGLCRIAAEVGTPSYVYSCAALQSNARTFRAALSDLDRPHIAFSVKANPNLAVLRVLANEGFGADIVSGGELSRALAAGMRPQDIVFSGVGKTREEMFQALEAGIGQLNIESESEGLELAELGQDLGNRAPCALRVNPDVDAGTHEKISTGKRENKFGVALDQAAATYARLQSLDGLNMRGLAVHIGSQLTNLQPLEEAFRKVGALVCQLRASGFAVSQVDLGGGLGVAYRPGDAVPSPAESGAMVKRVTRSWNVRLTFEPGRIITGDAGVLLTRVIRVKGGSSRPFVVVDAGMNDLARPALYGAWHEFQPVLPRGQATIAHIVGPVCETGDTFAMERQCDALKAGDLAIFRTAGAYGATMANSYNSRGFAAQVLVSDDFTRRRRTPIPKSDDGE